MPNLQIVIGEHVWAQVVEALAEKYGPPPEGVRLRDWAEGLVATIFAEAVATPPAPEPQRSKSRIRPSRART